MSLNEFALPKLDGGSFAVGRVFCVGQNYAEHAREMGSDPDRVPPCFFMKAPYTLTQEQVVAYPPRTNDLHHEVELVVAIGKAGANIAAKDAMSFVAGYAVGLDMTRRDLQTQAKAARHPWETAKNFVGAGPIGPLAPASAVDLAKAEISLYVNGIPVQYAHLTDLIWPVPDIIAELSTYQPLAPGDLIFTGTPAGVGAVNVKDKLSARITGLPNLEISIGAAAA